MVLIRSPSVSRDKPQAECQCGQYRKRLETAQAGRERYWLWVRYLLDEVMEPGHRLDLGLAIRAGLSPKDLT